MSRPVELQPVSLFKDWKVGYAQSGNKGLIWFDLGVRYACISGSGLGW